MLFPFITNRQNVIVYLCTLSKVQFFIVNYTTYIFVYKLYSTQLVPQALNCYDVGESQFWIKTYVSYLYYYMYTDGLYQGRRVYLSLSEAQTQISVEYCHAAPLTTWRLRFQLKLIHLGGQIFYSTIGCVGKQYSMRSKYNIMIKLDIKRRKNLLQKLLNTI